MPLNLKTASGGSVTLTGANTATDKTITVPAADGTMQLIQQATAVTASGTAVNFTDIPSWVKRITVMFSGVSTNGTSNLLVQIGSGSFTTSGYASTYSAGSSNTISSSNSTAGFIMLSGLATAVASGVMTIQTLGSNVWVSGHTIKSNTTNTSFGGGDVTLSGTLDRLRITTVNGTDTFDAGTINIMYEG